MAAGLGFKTFNTGDVLSAADVNGYLMQGVLVFADATARDAAITSPQEGQFAYTKDNNSLWYYTGSAWAASGATGDIEGVTAGVGISGGGTSGTVTITNSMATAIDAKGDLIVGTGADTFSRLAVGTNNYILTADSAEATGMKWAAASGGGGMTLINTGGTTLSGSSVTISSIPSTYKNLYCVIKDAVNSINNERIFLRINGDTGSNYFWQSLFNYRDSSVGSQRDAAGTYINLCYFGTDTDWARKCNGTFTIPRYAESETHTIEANLRSVSDNNIEQYTFRTMGLLNSTSAVSSIAIGTASGTFSSGTVYLYGVS